MGDVASVAFTFAMSHVSLPRATPPSALNLCVLSFTSGLIAMLRAACRGRRDASARAVALSLLSHDVAPSIYRLTVASISTIGHFWCRYLMPRRARVPGRLAAGAIARECSRVSLFTLPILGRDEVPTHLHVFYKLRVISAHTF